MALTRPRPHPQDLRGRSVIAAWTWLTGCDVCGKPCRRTRWVAVTDTRTGATASPLRGCMDCCDVLGQ